MKRTSMDQIKKISQLIKKNNQFLVATHYNADGDAIGSLSAFGHLLKRLNKKFALYIETGVPERFSWINLPTQVLDETAQAELSRQHFEWIITLDCADPDRLGTAWGQICSHSKIINIDHHLGNPEFGSINWVDPEQSSVGEMIGELALAMSQSLDNDLGEGIFLALVSDSGWFSQGNTRPKTMELAALILKNGLNLNQFTPRMTRQWTLNKTKLHGRAMQKAKLFLQGKIGLISVTKNDMKATGTSSEDCEGLVTYMRQIKGVEVAASLREEGTGCFKFSLRSWGSTDVRGIATQFNGGGHSNAAGGSIQANNLSQAEHLLVTAIEQSLGLPSPSLVSCVHSR